MKAELLMLCGQANLALAAGIAAVLILGAPP